MSGLVKLWILVLLIALPLISISKRKQDLKQADAVGLNYRY